MGKLKLFKRNNVLKLLFGLWRHLALKSRLQLNGLFVVIIFSAFSELLTLGAVLPFLEVITKPEDLWKIDRVKDYAMIFGLSNKDELILPITLIFITLVIISTFIRLANLWLNSYLASTIGTDLSTKVYSNILKQPYWTHIGTNSNSVITTISSEVLLTVGVLNSTLQFITSGLI